VEDRAVWELAGDPGVLALGDFEVFGEVSDGLFNALVVFVDKFEVFLPVEVGHRRTLSIMGYFSLSLAADLSLEL
jgi:hypothetical protein